MIKIKRLKVVIKTFERDYGFDENFSSGLNFISSSYNTCGKSSVIEAVYYCLGLEEILGGVGEKVLTSAYKTFITYLNRPINVLEAGAFLEITNGTETITIFRSAKKEGRKHNLVNVFFSNIDEIYNPKTRIEDMYVLMPNAAESGKGFHSFLEAFIGINLPYVPSADDHERKLYLQLVFSCMFIEQKRGWADLFSGMPYLGIKDAKKRVIEFILQLDTFENEKLREQLAIESNIIKQEWLNLINNMKLHAERELCLIKNLSDTPHILSDDLASEFHIIVRDKENTPIDEYIVDLESELTKLNDRKPKIIDNFDALHSELQETEKAILDMENIIDASYVQIRVEDAAIKKLEESIDIIEQDIMNNKDAKKLKALGSQVECKYANDICPVCNQTIHDTLLPVPETINIMSIDDNIRHLEAQRDTFIYALNSHKTSKENHKDIINTTNARLISLRRLVNSLRSDLFSLSEDNSEALVYKKVEIRNKLASLKQLSGYIADQVPQLSALSKRWKSYIENRERLPKDRLSVKDKEKLLYLRQCFLRLLRSYGYRSVGIEDIMISYDTYLPVIELFDLKYDSSASDNIRVIWAYTLSLLYTSIHYGANHPGIIIFDEPIQHSIINSDVPNFFQSILDIPGMGQVIVGITIRDMQTAQSIENLPGEQYKQIDLGEKAFIPLGNRS